MQRKQILLGSIIVLILLAAGLAAIPSVLSQEVGEATRGEPDLDIYLPDSEVDTGSEAVLELQVQNDGKLEQGMQGDRVYTARSTTVDITDSGPFEVKSGEQAVGSIQDGMTQSATMEIVVPNDIDPGSYDITVETSYSYDRIVSDHINAIRQESRTETHDVTVVVTDNSPLLIENAKTDVEPGSSGDATLEIRNTGTEPVNETHASISGSGIVVDGETAEEHIGNLEPNESTVVSVDIGVDDAVSEGTKSLQATFTYRDTHGIERETAPTMTSLPLGKSQSFSINNIVDTLSVGYDGHIGGEITNEGPRAIDDAVLVVEPMSETLYIEDTRYALPPLEPGETTTFTYPTDVSGQADAGPRQLRFSIEYTGSSGEATLEDGPFTDRVTVDERTDEFALGDDPITVQQGDRTEFALEITNQREETLSNIDAQLYTDSPLSTVNDEAFVPALEPGESTELTFDVAASESAPTEYHRSNSTSSTTRNAVTRSSPASTSIQSKSCRARMTIAAELRARSSGSWRCCRSLVSASGCGGVGRDRTQCHADRVASSVQFRLRDRDYYR